MNFLKRNWIIILFSVFIVCWLSYVYIAINKAVAEKTELQICKEQLEQAKKVETTNEAPELKKEDYINYEEAQLCGVFCTMN